MKVLKRHSRLAVTLAPKAMPRSMVADDIVGMTVAGLAMSAALVTIWLAQRKHPLWRAVPGHLCRRLHPEGAPGSMVCCACQPSPETQALFSQCSVKHGGGHMP